MKKKLTVITIIFICIVILLKLFLPKGYQLSQREKVNDFLQAYNTIKDGYPYLDVNKRRNNIDWLANKEKYIKRIKDTENDEEYIKELCNIIAELDNKHTELISSKSRYEQFKKSYSKNNWFNFLNEKKVIERYDSISSKIKLPDNIFLKKELILEDIVKGKVGYIYLPSMSTQKGSMDVDFKTIRGYIDSLKSHQTLIIDVRDNLGGSDKYWQNIVSNLITNDITIYGSRLYRNNSNIVDRYTKIRNLDLEPIKSLSKDVLENTPKEVLKDFSDFEKTSYTIKSNGSSKYKGKIYVLINEKIYSSSELFSMFCKETKFATLIGKTTGGDGGSLDPILFKLDKSGLIIRMASGMYINKYGVCNEEFKTIPDYEVKNSNRTNDFNEDDCIRKVLEIENISF